MDDIVFNVPIDIEGESLLDGSDTAAGGRLRKTRETKDIYRPLRIHLHYDKNSISK